MKNVTTQKVQYIAKVKEVVKTAKLNQQLFFSLSNGSVNVSKSSLLFMLHAINYVAKDGRIYLTPFKIRQILNIQQKTYIRVVQELTDLQLLSEQDGFLYSHFHVLSGGDKKDATYIKNLAVFTSPLIKNLTKNQLRFFMYVASRGLINGVAKSVAVESLYSNKYHNGVNYIESYQDLVDILVTLVSKGLIEVIIKDKVYNENFVKEFEADFFDFCGYKHNLRKKRMSKIQKHVIGLRVNPSVTKEEYVVANESSRREIEYYADLNCFFHTHLRENTIPLFIDVQNKLFTRFGLIGVKMYRHALVTYFSVEKDNVIYHDLYADENTSKAVNTMVNFYLMKDIIGIIANAASLAPAENEIIEYFKNEVNLISLVDYFNTFSSDDHKILLDEALENVGVSIDMLTKKIKNDNPTENCWLHLQSKISNLYGTIKYPKSILSESFQKSVMRHWAKEGIFTRKELLNQAVKKLKSNIIFLPTSYVEHKPVVVSEITSGSTVNKSNVKTSDDIYKEKRSELAASGESIAFDY